MKRHAILFMLLITVFTAPLLAEDYLIQPGDEIEIMLPGEDLF